MWGESPIEQIAASRRNTGRASLTNCGKCRSLPADGVAPDMPQPGHARGSTKDGAAGCHPCEAGKNKKRLSSEVSHGKKEEKVALYVAFQDTISTRQCKIDILRLLLGFLLLRNGPTYFGETPICADEVRLLTRPILESNSDLILACLHINHLPTRLHLSPSSTIFSRRISLKQPHS